MADIPIDPRKARYVIVMTIAWIGLLVGLTVFGLLSPYTSRFGFSLLAFVWACCLPFLWRHCLVLKTAYFGPNRGLHMVGESLIFATRKYKALPVRDIVSCKVTKLRHWARDLPYLQLVTERGGTVELPIFLLTEGPEEVGEHVSRLIKTAGAKAGVDRTVAA